MKCDLCSGVSTADIIGLRFCSECIKKVDQRIMEMTLEPKRLEQPVYTAKPPSWLRWIGLRYFDDRGCHRMKWGELTYGSRVKDAGFGLFSSENGFSWHIEIPYLFNAFIKLPFLNRFHTVPDDICWTWGFSTCDGALHLKWGWRYKIITFPWNDWRLCSRDVMNELGLWEPFVGCWEDRTPDNRHIETHPYRYMLKDGTVQKVDAKCHAERRIYKLRLFPFIKKTYRSINVHFSGEVGERAGSWKGGCVGCSYDLKPGETIEKCLRRMEQERRFR